MSLMDPETGRCRRTDGKMWRCRKDVVPDQKYCERHMHRGRSRKRVEALGVTEQSNSHTITCSNSNAMTTICSTKTSQIKSYNLAVTSAKFLTPITGNCENKNPSCNRSKGLTKPATNITTSANSKSKPTNILVKKNKSSSRENSDHLDSVDAGSNQVKDTNKGNSANGDKHGGSVTSELIISSKSVVYGDTKEPQRCKRTDGKKWQCSREAIPQKKYCDSHINRGSKRCRSSSEAATAAATLATLVTLKNDHTNLNTDLSILHAKCPATVIDVESLTSGSK